MTFTGIYYSQETSVVVLDSSRSIQLSGDIPIVVVTERISQSYIFMLFSPYLRELQSLIFARAVVTETLALIICRSTEISHLSTTAWSSHRQRL